MLLSFAATGFANDGEDHALADGRSDRPEVKRPYDIGGSVGGDKGPSSPADDADERTPPPPTESDDRPAFELKALDENEPEKHSEPIPVDESDGLDADELVAIALSQHPSMRQARVAVEKARGLQYQSGRKYNPSVGYMASEVGNEGALGQQGIYVGQTFVRGNKLHLNTHIYGAEIDRVRSGVELQSLKIARQVRERYFELVYARRRVQVLRRLLALSEKNVSIAKARYAAEEVSKNQVFQAKLETQQLQLSLRQSVTRSKAAELHLANIMGVPDFDVGGRVSPPQNPPLQLSRESLWEELSTKSPELAIARANVTKAEWAIQRARVQPIGNVETQFSLQFDDSTNDTLAGIQVGVPIAVHDHNLGGIQATEADYVRACSEERRLQLVLRDRLTAAYLQYQLAMQSRAAAADEMLPVARENLELTTERYDLGEVEFTELLLAQRMYLKIRLSLLEADSELWKIITAFEQLLVPSESEAAMDAETHDTASR